MTYPHQPYIRAAATALQDAGLHVTDYACRTGILLEAEILIRDDTVQAPGRTHVRLRQLTWDEENGWRVLPYAPPAPPRTRLMEARPIGGDLLPEPGQVAADASIVLAGGPAAPADRVQFRDARDEDGFIARLARDYPARAGNPDDLPGRGLLPPDRRLAALPGQSETRSIPAAARTAAVRLIREDDASWLICEAWEDNGRWRALGLASPPAAGETWTAGWTELQLEDCEAGGFRRDLDWTPVPAWQTTVPGMWGSRVGGLGDETQAVTALAEFPDWASRAGLHDIKASLETARAMILARFPGACDTVYTFDVPALATLRIRTGDGERTARDAAAVIDTVNIDLGSPDLVEVTDWGFLGGEAETEVEPVAIAVRGPAALMAASTLDGRDVHVTADGPADVPPLPGGTVILDPETANRLVSALSEAQNALASESTDDKHRALTSIAKTLGGIVRPRGALDITFPGEQAAGDGPREPGTGQAARKPPHCRRPPGQPGRSRIRPGQ
jgi:hypothetical protein